MMRPSSLPTVAKCPASPATAQDAQEEFGVPSDVDSDQSVLGTAYHLLMEAWHRGEDVPVERVAETAAEYSVDREDLLWLWSRLSQEEFERSPDTFIEERITVGSLSGQPDLVRYFKERKEVVVDDWKTGRLAVVDHAASNQQLRTYAVMCAIHLRDLGHEVEIARANLWAIRSRTPTSVTFEGGEIDEEWSRIETIVEAADTAGFQLPADRKYRTGDHCTYCSGRILCPAYREDARAALMVALDAEKGIDMTAIPLVKSGKTKGQPNKNEVKKAQAQAVEAATKAVLEENVDRAWRYRTLLKRLRDGLDQAFDDHLEFFGPIECEDGLVIERREFDTTPRLNIEHVREALGYAELSAEQRDTVLTRIDMREKVKGTRKDKRIKRDESKVEPEGAGPPQ